ncbi:MAG: Na(+)/H(+) antiporter subunit D [Verrucomicrobia bacterium]|nr:Na(+)/H(+) antiporter subunit D [Verrucomicrobiota bacterium]
MIPDLHPGALLLLGGLLVPLLRGRLLQVFLCVLPIAALVNMIGVQAGADIRLGFMGYDLHVVRVDKLSLLFGYLFHIAAMLASIYSLHVKDRLQLSTGLIYAGSAVGAVFAGDLITLFVFWELLALTSVFQVWARKSKRSAGTGLRYLMMHIFSGLLLLAGATWYFQSQPDGSLGFNAMTLGQPGSLLIFLAFGIKCAFPFFHTWLTDAYPEATPTGTVFLCSFTTKTAVYAMARGFPGADELVIIGGCMAMFPIFYAVIENDLRRVLGYSMINQIGFMMVGIGLGEPGVGTAWGINGAVAHAFNDVLFKGLLFMSMGAVLLRTGRINGSDLGGLYKSMPWTTGFCIVGAASISAFPAFSGFVSKAMVMSAAAEEGHFVIWLCLLFASAGVFHHAGIKIPFFAFFGHDSGIRTKEAPFNMLVAMGAGAFLCVFIGCAPKFLYDLLPVDFGDNVYRPYTITHIITQTQILFFSAAAFTFLMLRGIYPPELRSTNLDFDWFVRKGSGLFYRCMDCVLNGINKAAHRACVNGVTKGLSGFFNDAPARVAVFVMVPVWASTGMNQNLLQEKKDALYNRVRLGTFPIGITALFAVLLLALMFLFSFRGTA